MRCGDETVFVSFIFLQCLALLKHVHNIVCVVRWGGGGVTSFSSGGVKE